MGQDFEYAVSVIDGGRHRLLADFANLNAAKSAARLALARGSVSLAVVKDREGVMVYACDPSREWSADEEAALARAVPEIRTPDHV